MLRGIAGLEAAGVPGTEHRSGDLPRRSGRPPIRARSIGTAAGFLKAIEHPADTSRMSAAMVVAAVLLVVLVLVVRSRRDETIEIPGASLRTSAPRSVEDMMLAGRKIEAIKLLRERTGLGLKEAKEEVERRQRRLQPN